MFRLLLATALLGTASLATATTVVVGATNDLYNAGTGGFDGSKPQVIDVTGLKSITFAVSAGNTVTVNGATYNDADGIGSLSGEYNAGGNGISAITAPTAGFIAGVFFGATTNLAAPAALNFTTGGTNFTSLSPLIQQSFFIGDGKTGDATGATQTFYVPAGAKTLYLGLTDACGYYGGPSCFGDNGGTFSVTATGSAPVGGVPEPAAWALMLAGFGLTGVVARRRRGTVVAA